jgi:hypothetical protein
MKQEIKEYLESLKEKFADNKYHAYTIKGSKIELIGTSKTNSEINELIDENLEDYVEKKITYIAIILYNIRLTKFVDGPVSVKCTIRTIKNSKLSTKVSDIKINSIHWTEKELEKYKLKKGDYKLIIKGLLDETIESNPYKVYTRKDLDEV